MYPWFSSSIYLLCRNFRLPFSLFYDENKKFSTFLLRASLSLIFFVFVSMEKLKLTKEKNTQISCSLIFLFGVSVKSLIQHISLSSAREWRESSRSNCLDMKIYCDFRRFLVFLHTFARGYAFGYILMMVCCFFVAVYQILLDILQYCIHYN